MAAKQVGAERKRLIASALSNHCHLPLLPVSILEGIENGDIDIKNLCLHILEAAGKSSPNDEATKWIGFAESFPVHSQECSRVLTGLNEELALKSVLLGNGLAPSEADVIVFAAIHSFVIGLPDLEKGKLPHVMRWIDYIQSKEDLGKLFEKVLVEKAQFKPQVQSTKLVAKLQADSSAKVSSRNTKKAEQSEAELNVKKSDNGKSSMGNKESTLEKKGSPETVAVAKDKELNVSVLNLQVGLIRKAWKHPSADSLLVEEIDVGDAKLRQVVSGLAKYYSPDELMNRRVVLITNVKPGKLRDVMSEGLVLCASNEDHTVVEPLIPPESAKIGERISFPGIDGKPEDILNPKKKQFEKVAPNLFTDDKGVAKFKGIPFMTSGGPCTSSIPKASIK